MKKTYLGILMVMLVALLTISVFAQPWGGKERHGKGPGSPDKPPMPAGHGGGVEMILRMKDKLGLTDEQITKLQALKPQDEPNNRELMKEKHQALQAAIESGDKDAIRTAAAAIGNAIGERAIKAVENKAKVDSILTDEQKATLKEMKEKRQQKMREMAENEQGRPGPMGRGPGGFEMGNEQRPEPATIFARIDTDGDGSISFEEFTAHVGKMEEHRGRPGPAAETEDSIEK